MAASEKRVTSRSINTLVWVTVLPLHRPSARLILLEGIHVHHPVEDHGMKCSSGCITSFRCGDRSTQAELRMGLEEFGSTILRRSAEIHMLVPLRHTQRDAFVQLGFCESFRCR